MQSWFGVLGADMKFSIKHLLVLMLLVAMFFPRLTGLMSWMKRHMGQIEKIMGLLLWTVGLLMLTGKFTDFSWWLNEQFPALQAFG